MEMQKALVLEVLLYNAFSWGQTAFMENAENQVRKARWAACAVDTEPHKTGTKATQERHVPFS